MAKNIFLAFACALTLPLIGCVTTHNVQIATSEPFISDSETYQDTG